MPSTINADNGAISGSAGVKTTADSSGVLDLQTNGTTRLTIDTSGNLGLGVTPSAWDTAEFRPVEMGTIGNFVAGYVGSSVAYIGANAYYNGGWKYARSSVEAAHIDIGGGAFRFKTAGTGTAGNAITWTQAMTLDSLGCLGLGTTSPFNPVANNTLIAQEISGSSYGGLYVSANSATVRGQFFANNVGSYVEVGARTNHPFVFLTNNTERARITGAEGDLLVGTSTRSGGKITALQSGAADTTFGYASSGSYANIVNIAACNRSANSAYAFFYGISNRPAINDGTGQDIEFNLRGDGNGYADGTWNNNGADYAEYFESATGGALTVGATVVLEGNKVREATASDPASAIMGVVRPKEPSKASMVVGNTAWNKWANKYLTDDFDRYIMEDHDVVEWTDEDGKQHSYESHNIPAGVTVPADAVRKTHDEKGNKFQHYKLNPAWDKDAEYTPREKRDEWIIVGLVGQVKVLKGKPVNDRWIKMRDVSAAVEEWMIR